MTDLEDFRREIRRAYPSLARGFDQTTERGGARLRTLANRIIPRYSALYADGLGRLLRCLANLVMEVNQLQLKYEIAGRYPQLDYQRALADVYRDEQRMTDYMLALVCTQFAWPNHFELFCFFEDQFVRRIQVRRALEIGPGHGLFGLTLLEQQPGATLVGIDISPASVRLSRMIADQFGQREAAYLEQDALQLPIEFTNRFDAVICGEMMEHMPDPRLLCRSIAQALTPQGVAYVTAAITAAAPDHIYEFTSEEEVIAMFKSEGLKVDSQLCAGTRAITERAKGAPRTLAAILRPARTAEKKQ